MVDKNNDGFVVKVKYVIISITANLQGPNKQISMLFTMTMFSCMYLFNIYEKEKKKKDHGSGQSSGQRTGALSSFSVTWQAVSFVLLT